MAYCSERVQWQREVHLFGFFDPEIETQPSFREMLTTLLVRTGAYWFPTPATAHAYLQALHVDHTERRLPLWTFHDHERAFAMAMQPLAAGEHAAGHQILEALYHQIVRTGEPQSRSWLLLAVQVIFQPWPRSS